MRGPFQVNDCLLSSSCVQCLGHKECSVYTGILCSHPMRNLSQVTWEPRPPPLTGGPFPTFPPLICTAAQLRPPREVSVHQPLPCPQLNLSYIQRVTSRLESAVPQSGPHFPSLGLGSCFHVYTLWPFHSAPWSLTPREIPCSVPSLHSFHTCYPEVLRGW